MPDGGERAYAYSKACGIIGKSFVGKRLSALADLQSLNEFDRLVFSEFRRDIPGRELLLDLERRILKRAVDQILSVIKSYQNPPELLLRQIRSYEYADLKTCLHYIQAGRKSPPAFAGIGSYGSVKFEFFPNLRMMLEDTEYDFLLKELPANMEDQNFDLTALETEMDLRYYTALKESLFHLSGEDRAIAGRILVEEISLRNCTWALRLRLYFNKSPDEVKKYLMDIKIPGRLEEKSWDVKINKQPVFHGPEISLAEDAVESLEKSLETRDEWKGWKWEKFLNPEIPGIMWKVDPRYFQNAASKHLYDLAMYSIHTEPLAVSAIFCFIKIKQFEEDILTSISEGLGLGMPCAEVFELFEAPL